MGLEIEAKFIVGTDADLRALAALREIGGFTLKPAGVSEMRDTYLDTTDRRLFAGGYACRLRESGGRAVVGMKSLVSRGSSVHVRGEWEEALDAPGSAARPELWPPGEARTLALALAGGAELVPLCRLHQTREKSEVSRGGRALFEMSADRAELPALYRGVEIELLPGATQEDLAAFTDALRQRFRLEPDPLSKFERALAAVPSPPAQTRTRDGGAP
jgi:inorganic triphosphatase YgiF